MRLSVRLLEHIRSRLPIYGCSKGTRHASQESSIHGNLLVFRHDLFHGVRITPYGKRDVRSLRDVYRPPEIHEPVAG